MASQLSPALPDSQTNTHSRVASAPMTVELVEMMVMSAGMKTPSVVAVVASADMNAAPAGSSAVSVKTRVETVV